jgi:hypothetical protein
VDAPDIVRRAAAHFQIHPTGFRDGDQRGLSACSRLLMRRPSYFEFARSPHGPAVFTRCQPNIAARYQQQSWHGRQG